MVLLGWAWWVRAQQGLALAQKRLVEGPAGDGFDEICGVFILAEGHSRLDAIHITAGGFEERQDIAAVLSIVFLTDSLPHSSAFGLPHPAFQNPPLRALFPPPPPHATPPPSTSLLPT